MAQQELKMGITLTNAIIHPGTDSKSGFPSSPQRHPLQKVASSGCIVPHLSTLLKAEEVFTLVFDD